MANWKTPTVQSDHKWVHARAYVYSMFLPYLESVFVFEGGTQKEGVFIKID